MVVMGPEGSIQRRLAVRYWQAVEGLANWAARPESPEAEHGSPRPRGRRWMIRGSVIGGAFLVGGTAVGTLMQHFEAGRDWTDPNITPTPTLRPHEQILALPRAFPGKTESQIRWERLGPLDVVEHSMVLIMNASKYLLLSFNRGALDSWYRHTPLGLASTARIQRFLVLSPMDVYDERTRVEAQAYIESLATQYDSRARQAGVDYMIGYISLPYLFGNLKMGYGEYPLPHKERDRFRQDVTRHLNQMLLLRLQYFVGPAPQRVDIVEQKIIQQGLDFIDRVPNPIADLPIRIDFIDHELLARSVPQG